MVVKGAHHLSLLLRFDALRQTPVDGMHRELLGMIKLHFQCIWATLEFRQAEEGEASKKNP